MAPRKPTTKSLEGDEANEVIKQYLKGQNRPYSATDVSSNLHNKVSKTKTDRSLKEMFEKGEIGGRASGKQWVYWCLQEEGSNATPDELKAMDETIASLRNQMPILKATLRAKQADLNVLRSAPTTAALKDDVIKLGDLKDELETRLRPLRSGNATPVTRQEMEQAEAELLKWKRKAEARKRMFGEVEAMLLEGMTKEELWEKLGIEDDDL